MPDSPVQRHLSFTAGQRRVLIVLLLGLIGYATIRYARNPTILDDPQTGDGDLAPLLADKINPNTADWQTLAILPGIGEKKARDIIAKREELALRRQPAFQQIEDLFLVKGIGGNTIDKLRPYLDFTRNHATSQPAQ